MSRTADCASTPSRRGWAQLTLVLVLSAVGLMALGAALLGAYEPPPPVRIAGVLLHDATIRVLLAFAGLGLLGVSVGVWRFRRWGWYAAVLIGVYALYQLLSAALARESGALVHVDLLALLVVACLPRLWLRRRRFGVGVRDGARSPETGAPWS